MRNRNLIRPCITSPLLANAGLYLTGYIYKKSASDSEDAIRIRFYPSAGFLPGWMFLWIVRYVNSSNAGKTNDTRVTRISDDEYEFRVNLVTVRAVKIGERLLMRVSVYLPEHEDTFVREIDSVAVKEISRRIDDMKSDLNRYDTTAKLPEIAEDESLWFESFDSGAHAEDRAADRASGTQVGPLAEAPESAA